MNSTPKGPVVLCILDGFGSRDEVENNAIRLANTPTFDRLMSEQPVAKIATSGLSVGLPEGQMGNSEVGHMNLGAGRVVMQDLPRIDAAVEDGSLSSMPTLIEFFESLKETGGTCHLMGLLSPGGVHSHQDHMVALARYLHRENIPVRVHAFLDGRDTPPRSALAFAEQFTTDLGEAGQIATVSGRYYAMDRDKNWERVEKAWRALALGEGQEARNISIAIQSSYADDVTDEFLLPHILAGYEGMKDGDALLMANFRADRAREILSALVDPAFQEFKREHNPTFSAVCGMVEYSSQHSEYMTALFPPEDLPNTLGEILATTGKRQLRIAETEKYAHVTFFLNGGREQVFDGEERILVPSPKVATYDLQPEMSAPEVTEKLCEAIASGSFDLIVVNFANGDMVGHTGVLAAAIKAVETLDASLARLEQALQDAGGVMLVTADHGNCEMMVDPETGNPHTAHTVGAVPAFLVNSEVLPEPVQLINGSLADIAPTILNLMGMDHPEEMTGKSLLTIKP